MAQLELQLSCTQCEGKEPLHFLRWYAAVSHLLGAATGRRNKMKLNVFNYDSFDLHKHEAWQMRESN